MQLFLIILVCIWLTAPLCENKRIRFINKTYSGTKVYMAVWGAILVALVAFRSLEVGNDTSMYHYIFTSFSKSDTFSNWIRDNWYTSGTELGFYFSGYIISKFADFRVFLIGMAAISVLPFIFVINRYSDNKPLSLFLYVTFSYYTFAMSGLRQAAAMGFVLVAYHFMKKKYLWRYLLFCALAVSFHSTAILFVPVYWIGKIPNNKITRILTLFGVGTAYVLRDKIWQIASMFSRQQYEISESSGFLMFLFMLGTVLLGIYYHKAFVGDYTKKNSELSLTCISNRELFYLQVLAVMLWPIASMNPAVNRVYYYYHIFFILFYPKLLKVITRKYERFVINVLLIIVSLGFFFTQVCNPIQKYVPYYFMWQR